MPYFTSSSKEDQAQAQKQQQHAARLPSKQEAEYSRDNEIISRGTTHEHPVHKEAGLRSGHPTRPSKQEADLSDNERPRGITNIIEARVHKEGHVLARTPSKDQQPKYFEGLKEQSRIEYQERKEEGGHVLARTPSKDQQPKKFDGLKEQSRIEYQERKEAGHDVLARTPSKDQQPKNFDGLKEKQSRIEYQERKEAAGHVLARIPSKDHQQSKNYAGRIETSVVPVKQQYPSKPPKQEDGDNKGPRHGTTTEYHHVSKKADMPKDQAPTLPQLEHRPKDNGGVTIPPADPPVNNYPTININVYVTDQPKSVDKINDAIKENNVKPANNLGKKTDAESSFCERCKKLCSIL